MSIERLIPGLSLVENDVKGFSLRAWSCFMSGRIQFCSSTKRLPNTHRLHFLHDMTPVECMMDGKFARQEAIVLRGCLDIQSRFVLF